ncbi:MAG: hypothetical protein ACRYGK_00630 [Janthinobacterium lividum]
MNPQLAIPVGYGNTLGQICEPMVDQINHLADDPAIGAELARLQAEGFSLLNGIIEDITAVLGSLETASAPPPARTPVDAATLRSDARQRQDEARERRELARDMVIDSLAGMDCEADDLDRQRFFLALLQADVMR